MRDLHLELSHSDLATTDTQTLWDMFVHRLKQDIDKYNSIRKAGTRDGFPWINQEIRRLMRKRNKMQLYRRWFRSNRPYDHPKFLEYKHLVRRASESAYKIYLGDILGLNTESDDQNMGDPPKVKNKKRSIPH